MRIPVFIKRIRDNPLLWIVMAFVSSIVGFTCFPLSTLFEGLFGRPKPLKIVIYFVVVILILTVTIFTLIREPHRLEVTKKWWFRAHMSFGVIIIPFFNLYGKEQREEGMKKEEKVFGEVMDLVTTGAFSLTALSLSRELWLGVGVVIFNYFLGVLLVLGMNLSSKICLPPAIFICYLLVMIRFYVDGRNNNNNPFPRAPENVEDGNINYNNNNSDVVQVLSTSQNVDGQNNSLIHRRGHGWNNSNNNQFQRAAQHVNGNNNYRNDEDEDEDEDEDDEDTLIKLYYDGILDRHPLDKT